MSLPSRPGCRAAVLATLAAACFLSWRAVAAPDAPPQGSPRVPNHAAKETLRAANEQPKQRRQAQVLEARYVGSLLKGQLVGEAAIRYYQPAGALPLLRLDPMSAAITSEPTLDGQPANAGEAAPGVWGVLSPTPGEHEVRFNWSARTDERPDGLHAVLEWPEAPVGLMRIVLPSDQFLDLRALRQAAARVRRLPDGQREWELAFGGVVRPSLEILIRPVESPDVPALSWCRQQAVHVVGPDGIRSTFDVDIEAIQGRVSPVNLELPPGWVPEAVVDRNRPGLQPRWSLAEPPNGGRLTIEPTGVSERRLHLEIRCRPLPLPPTTANPGLRFPVVQVADMIANPATIRVHVLSGIRLADWQFGDFVPTAPPAADKEGGETYVLEQTQQGPRLLLRIPQARLDTGQPPALVESLAWWRIGVDRATLHARLTWNVREGAFFQVGMRLPSGYDLDEFTISSGEDTAGWNVSRHGQRIVAEFRGGPLVKGAQVRVDVRLRSTTVLDAGKGAIKLPVPHVVPENAAWVNGWLAVSLQPARGETNLAAPRFAGAMRGFGGRPAAAPAAVDVPWSDQVVDLYFAHHEADPAGVLELTPVEPAYRCKLLTDVIPSEAGGRAVYVAEIEPLAGLVRRVSLRFSAPVDLPRWEVAAGTGRLKLASERAGAPGTWDFVFAEPLSGPVTLRAHAMLAANGELAVPLPRSVDTGLFDGRVQVRLASAMAANVRSEGLWPSDETDTTPSPDLPAVWQAFRYGAEKHALSIHGLGKPPLDSVVESVSHQRMLDPNGTVRQLYEGVLRNPHRRPVSVRLPAGATLEAVWLNGRTRPHAVLAAGEYHFPADQERVQFSIQYRETVGSQFTFGMRLSCQGPTWPPEILVLQRRDFWLLPRGLTPVSGRWRRVGVSPSREPLAPLAMISRVWAVGEGEEPEWARRQRDLVARAWQDLSPQRAVLLQEPFDRVLLHLQAAAAEGGLVFVVDEAAMLEVQRPLRPLHWPEKDASPSFDGGFVLVPCREGVLVTTRDRIRAAGLTTEAEVEAAFGDSVREAVIHGHDLSGRFRTLSEASRRSAQSVTPPQFGFSTLGSRSSAWEQWEYLGVIGEAEWFWCIRDEHAAWCGFLIALAAACSATMLRRKRRLLFLLMVSLLAGGWLVQQWLPTELRLSSWWLLAAGGFCFLLLARRGKSEAEAPASAVSRLQLVSVVVVLAGIVTALTSQASADALAPADLPPCGMEAAPPGLPSFTIGVTTHRGAANGGRATFESILDVSLHVSGPVKIPLAFDDIRLRRAVWIRGLNLRAAPVVPQANGDGYEVALEGMGRHTLWLSWETTVLGRDSFFQVRCGVPAGLCSRVHFEVPKSADGLRASAVAGGQWLEDAGDGVRLDADLGRGGELQLSWRRDPRTPPKVRLQEFHLCDLQMEKATLRSFYRIQVSEGALPTLLVGLPASLDVSRVELRPETGSELPTGLVRHWRVAERNGRRMLIVQPVQALTGATRLLVEQIWRTPLSASPAEAIPLEALRNLHTPHPTWLAMALCQANVEALLRDSVLLRLSLPTPHIAGEGKRDLLLAVAAERVRVEQLQPRGLVRVPISADVVQEWSSALGVHLLNPDLQLFRLTTPSPFAFLARLRPLSPRIQARQSLAVLVSDAELALHGQLELESRTGTFCYAEWHVPRAVRISSVEGPELLRWGRRDDVLQLWFRRPVGLASVRLMGLLPASRDAAGREQIVVPNLRHLGADPTATRVVVEGRTAADLAVLSAANLRELSGPLPRPDQVRSFVAASAAFKLVLQVQQPKPDFAIRMLTTLSGPQVALQYRTAVECNVQSGYLSHLTFRVRHWPNEQPPLVLAEEGLVQRSRRIGDQEWIIEVDCPEQATRFDRQLRLQIVGVLALPRDGSLPLPEIDVQESRPPQRFLSRLPRGLQAQASVPLPAADASGLVLLPNGSSVTLRAPNPTASERLRVYLAESQLMAASPPRFGQEIRYTLWHEENATLEVQLPAAAALVSVELDGQPYARFHRQRDALTIQLPARAGWARVGIAWSGHLTWHNGQALAPLPRSRQVQEYPTVVVMHLPEPHSAGAAAEQSGRRAAATAEVARAEALGQFLQALAERMRPLENPATMLRAQEAFYQSVQVANEHIRVARIGVDSPLGRKLARIVAENHRYFRDTRWEAARRKAEESARSRAVVPALDLTSGFSSSLGAHGKPAYLVATGASSELTLDLQDESNRARRMLFDAIALLGVLLVAALAVRSSRLRRAANLYWPEALLAAAVLWPILLSPRWFAFVLLVVGLTARFSAWAKESRRTVAGSSARLPAFPSDASTSKVAQNPA